MQLITHTPAKSLSPAFRTQSLLSKNMEHFQQQFTLLRSHVDNAANESEEHLKNIVADFLKGVWYRDTHYINTRDRQDLVIHTGKTAKDPVGVILEVKRPGNRTEMITAAKPNGKALHELLRYYLNERQQGGNREMKRLIITNIEEWYIFDAADFEKHIYSNASLLKRYDDWREGRLGANNTDWFYKEIAAPFFEKELPTLDATYFRLDDLSAEAIAKADKDDRLLDLYKILSPEHLLKKPFANDANSLNKQFYDELLYILGLEEFKKDGKKVIQRAEKRRHEGSLLENTLNKLEVTNKWRKAPNLNQLGEDEAEARFSIALELAITWLNRILFLKLLEAQLKRWKPNDEFSTFLKADFIKDFDDLSQLFFEVLNRPLDQRRESIRARYGNLPYLNSSLFEPTALEDAIFSVETLDDRAEIPLAANTVLKDGKGDRRSGKLITLHYLFAFLDAYDFSSDSKARIQADDRAVINAAVLGLIFEKINGYRDGSLFTPGFITMYMCHETLRRAVLQKFNDRYGWSAETFEDLHNRLDYGKVAEYNDLINSLRICDPAVGSGHFLVSALNELIALKSDLGILSDRQGNRLHDVRAVVGNDELILTNTDTDQPIEYRPGILKSQRIQEALFQEKQTLIENCLFGVDINPKSVMICQLRLWIELLKHAYFLPAEASKLETLPNIDINIKTGNSLISRFALDEDLSDVFRKQKFSRQDYLLAVQAYKNARNKAAKEELRQFIQRIKDEFRQTVYNRNPFAKRLSEMRGKLVLLDNNIDLFGEAKRDAATIAKERPKLEADIADLERQLEDYKTGPLYRNSFEWRFEFPEVLDDAGNFVGFDVVVGNPPYGDLFSDSHKQYIKSKYSTYQYKFDAYIYFFEIGMKISRDKGLLCYITPELWLTLENAENLRALILQNASIEKINVWGENVFEDAVISTATTILSKENQVEHFEIKFQGDSWNISVSDWKNTPLLKIDYRISPAIKSIFQKIQKNSAPLNTFGEVIQGLTAYDSYRGQSKELIKTRGYHSNEKIDSTYGKWLDGKNVERYINSWGGEWLSYGNWLAAAREKRFFEGKRILFREIPGSNKRIQAQLVEETLYHGHSISPFKIYDAHIKDIEFILGCVNAAIVSFYAQKLLPNFGKNIFPKLNPSDIKQIPIPLANREQKDQINNLVTQILTTKQADPKADTLALDTEIDQLVYGLYGLTEEEIKIVEGT